ncbi:MAG TPA: SRPBCC family protein [Roseiflexaceae bacterium]|nr:SRPBCC family protein [Roseiflexaceae bacterium]
MINVEVSTVIDRPLTEVFAFVSNFANHPQWEANFLEGKRLTPDPVGVGTRYQCVLKVPGQRVVSNIEITDYEPNRSIAFRGDQPAQAKPVGRMTFEAVENGTKVTLIPRPEFGGIFTLLEPLMAGYIRRSNAEHLRTLKTLLERQA